MILRNKIKNIKVYEDRGVYIATTGTSHDVSLFLLEDLSEEELKDRYPLGVHINLPNNRVYLSFRKKQVFYVDREFTPTEFHINLTSNTYTDMIEEVRSMNWDFLLPDPYPTKTITVDRPYADNEILKMF